MTIVRQFKSKLIKSAWQVGKPGQYMQVNLIDGTIIRLRKEKNSSWIEIIPPGEKTAEKAPS